MLPSSVNLVADLRAGAGSSPISFTPLNGVLYFNADDGVTGRELWRHDPSTNTTSRVADINGGSGSALDNIDQPFTVLNNQLYFVATDGVTGRELWRHDPATNATARVADVWAGAGGADIGETVAFGDSLYFTADDGVAGNELWRHNPLTGVTERVADTRPGLAGSFPTNLTPLGSRLYFSANNGLSGNELWRYDLDTGATSLVFDVRPGSVGSTPTSFGEAYGSLYFSADDGINGRELWRHDSVAGTTTRITDVEPGAGSATPTRPIQGALNWVYFYAQNAATGRELWRYHAGTGVVELVADIRAGSGSAFGLGATSPIVHQDRLYFAADDGVTGREFWRHDVATNATSLAADLNAFAGSDPNALTVFDGQIHFTANNGSVGNELWRYDPSTGLAALAADVNPTGSSAPASLRAHAGKLYFSADDGTRGREPWVFDPTLPVVSIGDVTVTEGESAVVTLTLSRPSNRDTSVRITTVNGIAESGVDFSGFSLGFTVNFPAGSVSATRAITTIDDAISEPTENFLVNLSSPNGLTIGDDQGEVTILDNDTPTVAFALASQTVAESAGTATIVVQLDRPAPADLLVPISVTSATAGAGDYSLGSTSVLIPAGATSGTVSITVVDDALNEATESLALALSTGAGFRLGTLTTHTLSILDNDAAPTVTFTTASQSVAEVSVSATVKARLSAISGRDVTVPLALSGSATLGSDYSLPTASSIVIPAGSFEGSLTINLVDDTSPEGNELIILNMGTPVNATKSTVPGAPLTHTVMIAANDAPSANFSTLRKSFKEGDSYTLTVQLSQPTPFPVTIQLVPDSTYSATYDADYTLSSTMITIPANQTSGSVTLSVRNDAVGELGESFRIAMGAMTNAQAGATWNFLGSIAYNDEPTIEFVTWSSTVWEDDGSNGTVLTIGAKLSNASSQPISVQVRVVDGQLTTSDYAFTDFSFDFPGDSLTKTATVSVTIKKDTSNEPTETFELKFGTWTGPVDVPYTPGTAKWKHTVTIKDNDPLVSFLPFVTKTTATTPAKTASPKSTTVERSVGEGDGDASVPVYISAPSNLDVTVPVKYTKPKANGAVKGTDYTGWNSVTIAAGDKFATLGMDVIDDVFFGAGVTFTTTLVTPTTSGGLANPSSYTTTIEENDFPVVYFASKPKTIQEPSGSFTVDLALTNATPLWVTVPINLSGTARIGSTYDYTITSTSTVSVSGAKVTISIPPNRTSATFTVNVRNDSEIEYPESVVMTIGSPTHATRTSTKSKSYTLMIESDDPVSSFTPIDFNPTPIIVDSGPLYYGAGQIALVTRGYVSGSFVFFDANKNGVHDFLDLDGDGIQGPDEPNEPSATTQPNGLFFMSIPEVFDLNEDGVVNPDEGRMVAIGGVDTASGTVMSSPLIAPGGSFVVSPFTSVMSALVENHGMTLEQAAARVGEALGLPADVDLTRFDPIAATMEGLIDGAIVFAADSQLTDTVEQVMSLVGGALEGIPLDFLARVAYDDLAAKIVEEGSILDLSEAAVAEALIQGVLYETGIILDPAIVEGAAKVVAEGNKRINAVEKTPDESFLKTMSKVQKVAQVGVSKQLADLGAGLVDVADVLASSTGQALTDLIAATPANDVVPSTILISDVTHVETDSGAVLYEFTATLDRPSTQTVSVRYDTADSTATLDGVDYEAASGVLTWAPGDTSPRTFQVLVHGDTIFEGDEAFLVVLSQAEHAIPSRGIVLGTIADDDPFVYTAPADDGDNQINLSIEGDFITLERNDEIVFAGALSTPVPITIIGANGVANSLRVDLLDAGAFLAAGLFFQGGDQAGDSLAVLDGTASSVSHVYGAPGAGTLTIDGAPISYSSVESVTDLIADEIGGLTSSVPEGSSLTFTVLSFDPENLDLLSFDWSLTRDGQPFASGAGPTFTGVLGDDGEYTVTLTTTNADTGAVGTTVASFVVTNAPPTVAADVTSTAEDTPVTIAVLANDSDPAGASDPLTVVAVTQGAHGSVLINANGTLTYTPAANYAGSDSFTYTVGDGDGGTATATVNVAVTAVADDPTVTVASPGGEEGSPIPVVITPALADDDGSEFLMPTRIRGVPIGAWFNHGTRLPDQFNGLDVWQFDLADLVGLTLTVPDGPATVSLVITAFTRESSNLSTAETSLTLQVAVANLAPTAVIVGVGSGVEGTAFVLNSHVTDPSGPDTTAGFTHAWTVSRSRDGGATFQPFGSGTDASITINPDDDGIYRVHLTATDKDGATSVVASRDVVLGNVAPTASTGGDATGVRGQIRTLHVSATDVSSDDRAAGYTFLVDWGDGSSVESFGPGLQIHSATHVYSTAGAFTQTVRAVDKDGGLGEPISRVITIGGFAFQADPRDPTRTALVIGGTTGNDSIVVNPGGDAGRIQFIVNGVATVVDPPTGHIIVYGGDGHDDIQVAGGLGIPTFLFGGDGDDVIKGTNAPNVIVGGAGQDTLTGGNGRDLIIGGLGADVLNGVAGDDLLIGGTTDHDDDLAALRAIMDEWTSSVSYATRVARLTGSGGLLGDDRVWDDLAANVIQGASGQDLFFASLLDNVNASSSETVKRPRRRP
ncbi:MAG: Calx-beta domain-containing protein [Isosphaeraceae bacterium]